jgi:hypothetical protein
MKSIKLSFVDLKSENKLKNKVRIKHELPAIQALSRVMAYISSVRALKIARLASLEINLNSYKFSRNRKILICTFSTPNLARNTWIRKNLRQRGKLTFFPFLEKKKARI